jgi:pimeloyl-ACP methyl ester carboxylesterase
MMHTQGKAIMRPSVRPLLCCLVLLVSACATPIGVTRVDTQSVYRSLTASVLTAGQPSTATEQVLVRTGLAQRFKDDPEATLTALRGSGVGLSRDRLFALAELSFVHAEDAHKPEYYLAAAVYAYAFLLPSDGSERSAPLSPIDPRLRLAADLYNLGLTLGLSTPARDRVLLEAGTQPLPFGTFTLTIDPEQFLWGGYRMSAFIPVAEFKLRGLRNHYRQPGVGVPLAAELSPLEAGPAAARKRIPPRVKVPVAAFVRLEQVSESIATGHVHGRLELYPADQATSVDVTTQTVQTVPLELHPSATLAYMLEGAPVWATERSGFLSANRRPFPEGLGMLQPYRRGRVPVVLIHGTVSSPARWADMLNELQNDPVLRDRIQFWLFTYNTSNPILLSASELREALRKTIAEVDPDGQDPALRNLVLIGHSQGGLLTRLMVTDSGTRFWDAVVKVPLEQLEVTPATRVLIEKTMFFEPLPCVRRVVFIATPHRGSFRVSTFVLRLVRRLVTLPTTVVEGIAEAAQSNPEAISLKALGGVPTAVDNMRPGNRFVQTLSASPLAPGVVAHSIIAVRGEGPITSGNDGVVAYESAHLDGVASEKVVRSSHSTQSEPDTIQEVRRILRAHVAETTDTSAAQVAPGRCATAGLDGGLRSTSVQVGAGQ